MKAFVPIVPNIISRSDHPLPTRKTSRRCRRVPTLSSTASRPPGRTITSLKNVSYHIAGVNLLEDVSLDVHDGEIVCILGPSGSGKSTILRILAGLTPPTRGAALYEGRPFRGPNPAASIVFQTFALYPWLTVLENVELGLHSATPALKRAHAMRAIDTIGLDGYENAYPRELSGGMRQRVGFARALAVEPQLLCMDEPFSALDVLTAENLRTELLRLWQAGDVTTTSVLIVTHGIEEAVTLADRIVILGSDPGHIRTILPVNMPHPRNRKSPLFQQVIDLVYTLLSQRDYTVSADDIRILNGETLSKSPVEARSATYRSDQHSSTLQTAPAMPGPEYSTPNHIALEGLTLSEPLQPVDLSNDLGPPDPASVRYPKLPAVRIGSVGGLLSFIAEEPADLYVLGQRLQLDVDDLYPLIDAASILGLIEVDEGDVCINSKGQRYEDASIDDRKNIVRMAALSAPGCRLIAQIYRLLSQAVTQKLPQELIFDTILLKHFSAMEARKQLEIAIEWGRFAELFGYESLTGTLFLDTGEDPDEIMQTS